MKEITLEDLQLTPEEMAEIVKGSQRFLPVRDEEGALADVTPDVDNDTETQTS
jgi:hypothetical protein